jgi:TM2 domain-containing membrane protein YozV
MKALPMENIFEQMLALCGLILTWVLALLGWLKDVNEFLQLIASIGAIVTTFFTARYYWKKTKKLDDFNP